jgi:hypothetical protein
VSHQFELDQPAPNVAHRLEFDRLAIVELVHGLLADGIGAWSFGVRGAAAEYSCSAANPEVRRRESVIESLTAEGGVRLTISSAVHVFAVASPTSEDVVAIHFGVPRSLLAPANASLTPCGTDDDALREADRNGHLFDLGINDRAAAFCVRTSDLELQAALEEQAGTRLAGLLDTLGADLIRCSPHRVVRTAVGRAEVYAPIPAANAQSPYGPHTHLLPGELDSDSAPTAMFSPPGDWASAVTFHPPQGWSFLRPGARHDWTPLERNSA